MGIIYDTQPNGVVITPTQFIKMAKQAELKVNGVWNSRSMLKTFARRPGATWKAKCEDHI